MPVPAVLHGHADTVITDTRHDLLDTGRQDERHIPQHHQPAIKLLAGSDPGGNAVAHTRRLDQHDLAAIGLSHANHLRTVSSRHQYALVQCERQIDQCVFDDRPHRPIATGAVGQQFIFFAARHLTKPTALPRRQHDDAN
ncbi:hypothetical protein D3C76_1268900 [compost metagenome]